MTYKIKYTEEDYKSPVYRSVRYRLLPETSSRGRKLARTAGACRKVWNLSLDAHLPAAKRYQDRKGPRPEVFKVGLSKWFGELRKNTPWLQEVSANIVRHTLNFQAKLWRRSFIEKKQGFPKYMSKDNYQDGFSLPASLFRVEGNYLYLEKIGRLKLRRRGSVNHSTKDPVKLRIKQQCDKWYATIVYRIEEPKKEDDGRYLGVDMNVGQVTDSTGAVYSLPNVEKEVKKRAEYSRKSENCMPGSNRHKKNMKKMMKVDRKIRCVRQTRRHQITRAIADKAGLIIIENLNTKGMLARAWNKTLRKGILASGWPQFRDLLVQKACHVELIDPAYTSQKCSSCGYIDANNRKRTEFKCIRCGFELNADRNAALNIMEKASEAGVSGRWKKTYVSPYRQKVEKKSNKPLNKKSSRRSVRIGKLNSWVRENKCNPYYSELLSYIIELQGTMRQAIKDIRKYSILPYKNKEAAARAHHDYRTASHTLDIILGLK